MSIKTTPEPSDRAIDVNGSHGATGGTTPPPEVWKPYVRPDGSKTDLMVNQHGHLKSKDFKYGALLPPIACEYVIVGAYYAAGWHWVFDGGSDEGYESEEDAEDARALLIPRQLIA